MTGSDLHLWINYYRYFYYFKLTKFREKRPNDNKSDSQLIQLLLKIVHVIAYLIPGLIIFLIVPSGKKTSLFHLYISQ